MGFHRAAGVLSLFGGLIALGLGQAQEFRPGPFERFDGTSWGGVELGVSTDGQLKRQFRTAKSPVRPEAIRLVTPRESGMTVDVLLNGRGDRAVAMAIRVEMAVMPSFDRWEALAGAGRRVFPWMAFEPWQGRLWADRGLLALQRGGQNVIFLYPASRETVGALPWGTAMPRMTAVADPGRGWNRRLQFSDVDVRVSISGQNRPRDCARDTEDRVEWRLEDAVRDFSRGGPVEYDLRGTGRYEVVISGGRFDNRGTATFTVTARVTGQTPYGTVEESVSDSARVGSGWYSSLVNLGIDAIGNLERAVELRMGRLRPPTPQEMTDRQWGELMKVVAGDLVTITDGPTERVTPKDKE
jgi:hypothetical protein